MIATSSDSEDSYTNRTYLVAIHVAYDDQQLFGSSDCDVESTIHLWSTASFGSNEAMVLTS
jgi:hypothetical protein